MLASTVSAPVRVQARVQRRAARVQATASMASAGKVRSDTSTALSRRAATSLGGSYSGPGRRPGAGRGRAQAAMCCMRGAVIRVIGWPERGCARRSKIRVTIQ